MTKGRKRPVLAITERMHAAAQNARLEYKYSFFTHQQLPTRRLMYVRMGGWSALLVMMRTESESPRELLSAVSRGATRLLLAPGGKHTTHTTAPIHSVHTYVCETRSWRQQLMHTEDTTRATLTKHQETGYRVVRYIRTPENERNIDKRSMPLHNKFVGLSSQPPHSVSPRASRRDNVELGITAANL